MLLIGFRFVAGCIYFSSKKGFFIKTFLSMLDPLIVTQKVRLKKVLTQNSKKDHTRESKIGSYLEV